MIIAYHAIWSAYGFWLPNDPRGSWSTEVWAKHLREFGDATKTDARRSLAHDRHDKDRRREAKRHLLFPPVRFSGTQARAIARGFGAILPAIEVHLCACAIMPDHVHVVAARDLAYRLYNICERKGWASEALAYNGLVIAWPEITKLAAQGPAVAGSRTAALFEGEKQ